jgi:uncharacterized protein YjbI with pentapeptide repeats
MANAKHVKLLLQGADCWNNWRTQNPSIIPDLIQADISRAKIDTANLSGAKFTGANLSGASLSHADLSKANFSGTDLTGATFKDAKLQKANLSSSYLNNAVFEYADLTDAILTHAQLNRACFVQAKLIRAKLNDADLSQADFSNADLTDVDLSMAQVIGTNFSNTILTGACVKNWNFDSSTNLSSVDCNYVYLRDKRHERCPNDRFFALNEFTRICHKSLEVTNLIFINGIHWAEELRSVRNLKVRMESIELSVHNIFVDEINNLIIQVKVPTEIELKNQLEGKNTEVARLEALVKQLFSIAKNSDKVVNNIKADIKVESKVEGKAVSESKSESQAKSQSESQSGSIHGSTVGTAFTQGGINNTGKLAGTLNESQQQNFAEAAREIHQLLQELDQTYPTTTTADKMAVATEAIKRVESNPTLKQRVIGALKAAGTEAFKEAINHPVANVLVAAMEGWQEGS